ncbi:uncharacterized protein LODBEIA_P35180 [Lodderomyces beijingensis]|uniref:Uncharacterized protein n=1 Tax=Lodderomyces beijingensis TaxID=1775926 RepID=A0ABP0ZMC5_9ASCO
MTPLVFITIIFTFWLPSQVTGHWKNQNPLSTIPLPKDPEATIIDVRNLQEFEKRIHELARHFIATPTSQTNQTVVHLIEEDHYLAPEIDYHAFQLQAFNPFKHESRIPEKWFEYYAENVSARIERRGIVVQTLMTVANNDARGEIAFSGGMLTKITSEHDLNAGIYAGYYIWIGGQLGAGVTPELSFARSSSTYYTCPVVAGRTAQIKVYPTLTSFIPFFRTLHWNLGPQKFASKALKFKKNKKLTLIFLSGLEDVECMYI